MSENGPPTAQYALRSVAGEFYDFANDAMVAAKSDGPVDGLANLDELSDDELMARSDAYRSAANRCRELADRLDEVTD